MVLGLFLSGNAIADDVPIKEKRLQCLHHKLNSNTAKKEDYLYIIFLENDKVGEFIQLNSHNLSLRPTKYRVSLSLYWINLKRSTLETWAINRQTGILTEYSFIDGPKEILYGKCEPIPANFYPKKYLSDLAKKRLKKEEDKIKY